MGRKVYQSAVGGWTPVINYHSRQGGTSNNQSLVTLFVDNLPEGTSQSWLKMMFNKYGVVKDVFIPEKRSKVTGNKFGFIRYDCPVSADLAVLRANGLWLDDKKLFVKIASFGVKGKMPNSIREGVNCSGGLSQTKDVNFVTDSSKEGINRNGSHKDFFVNNGRSYAQVLYGDKFPTNNDTKAKATTRISVNEIDSEWLSRSIVAKLKSLSSLESIREAIHCSGVPMLEVKDMGGLWVVVTFPSSEQMLSVFDGELGWLNNWFDEVKKWSPTFEEARSRNIWISCYGVPLHCWSAETFNKIARLWGEVLAMDDATVKGLSFAAGKIMIATKKWDKINDIIQIEVKGIFYDIRVVEEQVVIHGHVSACSLDSSKIDSSKANSVDEANSRLDMEDGGWMKNNAIFKSCSNEVSLVEDSAVLVSKEVLVAEKGACVKVGDNSIQGDDSVTNSIEEDNACEKEGDFSSQEVDSKTDSTEEGEFRDVVHHHIFNEGDIPINKGNSYMDQEPILDANKSGALLDDQLKRESFDANKDKEVVDFDQGFWNLSEVGFFKEKDDEGIQLVVDLNPSNAVKDIGKGKWKQKRIEEKLGYPKSKKKGRRKEKKCVVFRSAIAAAALSVSSEGINKIHLNATQAARSISKILDEDYLGDDNEIISSFSVAS